ncbi:hypothetical protein AMS68_005303 [Peltaster fructicola]|uniref:Tetratricopeptide SHNi-TPR domain-containing protein n=1 Tax=Peltaster fructicola TaxID=286661 RepID=A0A6H0XYN4_9PEZI|nr:hypothetical protein AMS68_005303 [Peltaster fructicola]
MSHDEPSTNAAEARDQPESTKEELRSKLKKLEATATQQYALKNYSDAAEAFSEAVEVQDAINGEMATENADLLYLYGRCLYHVGVSNSDVLGGKVAQQEEPKRKKRKIVPEDLPEASGGASKQDVEKKEQGDSSTSKPFFQITGDENWTDSEEEEDNDKAEGEPAEEEDDDLAIAYEILDSARVLFMRKLESIEGERAAIVTPGKSEPDYRALRERLADTYDLQAEIKLENEQFKDAVNDAQQALTYKLSLYPQESGLIAEAHYKLSIALDFAALPVQSAETGEAEGVVNEDMRKQAAEEMEKAIMSCQARTKKLEASLAGLEGAKLEHAKRDVADTRGMVQDMKNRLVDLRTPLAGAASAVDDLSADSVKGLLGELLGQSKAEQLKMLAQATANANDLTGLVKQKKKPKTEATVVESAGKGKRKLGDIAEDNEAGKKVKLDSAQQS